METQLNNKKPFLTFSELDKFGPTELMLISEIMLLIFIVVKLKDVQHGLKGQCVLVPTDFKRIQVK